MKMKNVFVAASAGLILLLLAACAALKPTPTQPAPTAEVLPATGIQYHFVTNKLMIPTTQAQTQAFALNVDGDSQQNLDNKFGELLTLLTSAAPGLELQSTLDQAVNNGQLVTLHVVKADDSLNDPSVSWSIYLGQKALSRPALMALTSSCSIPLHLLTHRLLARLRTATSQVARAQHESRCFCWAS
jgi:hypothetical protein